MSASKDTQRGTWKVYIRYKDWQGENQIHTKRGFATKREALEYSRQRGWQPTCAFAIDNETISERWLLGE